MMAVPDALSHPERPAISVLVVTHNNEDLIETCLRSIRMSARERTLEVIVLDNGSVDRTLDRAGAIDPRAHLVGMGGNTGFAAANNHGLSLARGNIVALVNSDCFPDPGSLDRLADALEADTRTGIVGGSVRYASGRHQPSAGPFPSIIGDLWVALFLHRAPLLSRLGMGLWADKRLYDTSRTVDWVSGCFLGMRADVGPLPEDSFMYGEDVELCRTAHLAGWRTRTEPLATAVHLTGASLASRPGGRAFAQRQRAQFAMRWYAGRGWAHAMAVRLVLVLHAVLRIALTTLRRPWPPARARAARNEYWALLFAALGFPDRGTS